MFTHPTSAKPYMDTLEKQNYQGLSIRSVRIVSVHPSRLVVSLPDRRRGVIFKGDWSWDRSVRQQHPEFVVGSKIDAVLIRDNVGSTTQRLSLRQLTDPWEGVQYAVGQTLMGEVVFLRHHVIYIQITPGITAVAYTKDLPIGADQVPEDVLALGDRVIATITAFNPAEKRIDVSLLPPLQQTEELYFNNLKDYFKQDLNVLAADVHTPTFTQQVHNQYFITTPIVRCSRILVLEDNARDAKVVGMLLAGELGADVEIVGSGKSAWDLLDGGHSFDLIITDINLDKDDNGCDFAQKLFQRHPDQPLALMSNNALAEADVQKLEQLLGRRLLFLEKPINKDAADLFVAGIQLLCEGKIKIKEGLGSKRDERMLASLERQWGDRQALEHNVNTALTQLCLESNLDHAFLLALDPTDKTVAFVGYHLSNGIGMDAVDADNLYFSLVRDIAEDGDIIYIGQTTQEKRAIQRHNFFSRIVFFACYGIPVRVPMSEKKYALVVLDKAPDISGSAIMRIRTLASYLSMTIEHNAMLAIVRKQQDLALQGILMGTMMHELNNKLSPFFGLLERQLDANHPGREVETFEQYINEVGADLMGIKSLLQSYTRLAKSDFQLFPVYDVVRKVGQQLKPMAQEKGIKMLVCEDTRNPQIWAIPAHVEQVLTNVALNAIQWVEEQKWQGSSRNTALGTPPDQHLQMPTGITIGVCSHPNEKVCCILVSDSGPGIPHSMRDQIFDAHISQRKEGQGLGLYISRNLAEAMHGRLFFVDSIRFHGSLFALLFPIAQPTQSDDHA